MHRMDSTAQRRFLSTPSARRATLPVGWEREMGCYFYPRPPRGGRQYVGWSLVIMLRFLSTPSARRATGMTLPR